jgi:hypothetical protein
MERSVSDALLGGLSRVKAWSDLLDQINVFPVADGDTGRNLVISLTPLGRPATDRATLSRQLMMSARGNSGNIATRFFPGFLSRDPHTDWLAAARVGRDDAWRSLADPVPGTMLTLFDALVEGLEAHPLSPCPEAEAVDTLLEALEGAVRETRRMLPRLSSAGVVDAGALGMFLFFEGFFGRIAGCEDLLQPATQRFEAGLSLQASFTGGNGGGCRCVEMLIQADGTSREEAVRRLSGSGESLLAARDGDALKIHIHTRNPEALKKKAKGIGKLMTWSAESLRDEMAPSRNGNAPLHIMTDAAGSLTRSEAGRLGITLLDSYIQTQESSLPETLLSQETLYRLMAAGEKVTTAQASVFERHQCYQSVLSRFDRVLYLCVGSAYTGNHAVAKAWQKDNDPDDRFTVLDTGAASGRLAVLVKRLCRYALTADDPMVITEVARDMGDLCEEYLFPGRLQYLAASGRLSKTGAFFADLLHVRPVITPTSLGARKAGVVRSRSGQIDFALEKLSAAAARGKISLILLEYTDNRNWVEAEARPRIARDHPDAEIEVQPLSLTAGAHLGPDTWAVAFVREPAEAGQSNPKSESKGKTTTFS